MKNERVLLRIESWLTVLPFTLSWLLSAIFFSVRAGYRMAAAGSEEKRAVLDKMWPKKSSQE